MFIHTRSKLGLQIWSECFILGHCKTDKPHLTPLQLPVADWGLLEEDTDAAMATAQQWRPQAKRSAMVTAGMAHQIGTCDQLTNHGTFRHIC